MASKKQTRYLKHASNGNVYIWTIPLSKRDDMLPCDKDGNLNCRADARFDTSDLSLREIIEGCRKKADLVDIAARYDLGFDKSMKLDEMKKSLLAALIEAGEIEPTDEEVESLGLNAGGGSKKDDDEGGDGGTDEE